MENIDDFIKITRISWREVNHSDSCGYGYGYTGSDSCTDNWGFGRGNCKKNYDGNDVRGCGFGYGYSLGEGYGNGYGDGEFIITNLYET